MTTDFFMVLCNLLAVLMAGASCICQHHTKSLQRSQKLTMFDQSTLAFEAKRDRKRESLSPKTAN